MSSRTSSFKVVASDNFGRSGEVSGFDEYVVTAMPLSERVARKIADALNEDQYPDGPRYYRVVEFNERLVRFES